MHWHIQLCIKCIFCVGERNKVPQLLQALPQLPEDILYSKLSFIFALINWIKSSTTKLNEQSHIKSLPSCRFGQLGEIPQHHALIKPLHFGQYSTKKKKNMADVWYRDGRWPAWLLNWCEDQTAAILSPVGNSWTVQTESLRNVEANVGII